MIIYKLKKTKYNMRIENVLGGGLFDNDVATNTTCNV